MIESSTGNLIWVTKPGTGCQSAYQCLSIQTRPSFAFGGSLMLLSVMDGPHRGRVHALATANGKQLWAVDAGGDLRASNSRPVPNRNSTRFFIAVARTLVRNASWSVAAFDLPTRP